MPKRDLVAELKVLKLFGMASAWSDVLSQGNSLTEQTSQWLLAHLLDAESTDRHIRSIRYQLHAARFPVHRDLAGFDFEASSVDASLIKQLATFEFADAAHNVVLVGGTGTGKTHLAIGIGTSGIQHHNKKVRFFSAIDLANSLEQEKSADKQGRLPAPVAGRSGHPR